MAKGALVLAIFLAVVLAVHTADARKRTSRKIRHRDPAPAEWDWRTKGAVPPVIDQGEIGNSLALDAAEVVSSYGFIKSGNFIKASPEELIDCCLNTSAAAVDSQLNKLRADDIYACVVNLHGLCWEADYPPVTHAQACMADKCTPQITISGGQYAKPNDVEGIKSLVYRNPAVAYVNAGTVSFQTYESGVYEDKSCDASNVDHVLIVVGYGQKDGRDVWYCKNSWGANWGEEGYIYIARGENICGIESLVSIPV